MTDDPRPTGDAELERMLTASAPSTTTVSPIVEDELARMTVAARTDTRPATGRSGTRVAAAGLAAVVLLGGAGAAAAATGVWTSWWASDADATYAYTLPSGAQCEARIGNVMAGTADRPMREAARDYLARVDLMRVIDVDAELARIRDEEVMIVGDDGESTPAPPGHRSEDALYQSAVEQAVATAITAELQRQGFRTEPGPDERGLTWDGETSCPGAQW